MIQISREDLTFHTNYEDMYKNIQSDLKIYIVKHRLKSLVLGISGGIDSALCAVLAKPVCDKLKIPLIGVSLPTSSNKTDEVTRAFNIGKLFCNKFKEIPIGHTYNVLENLCNDFLDEIYEPKMSKNIRHGNIKARLRMIYLYNLAQFYNGMVLSTDNYTEYLLGFWTLHGDVGDYCPFQNLWKTEVYGLAQWIVDNKLTDPDHKKALQDCINAVPTDGLGITDSDLDQLGCKTYADVDIYLLSMFFPPVELDGWPTTEYLTILKRHEASEFKRNNPYNPERYKILMTTKLPF